MNETRKQIIEIISDYMNKTLGEGCLILNDVGIEEMVLFDSGIHPIKGYGYIKTTGSELKYDKEKAEYTKIIGRYDITAVLKYIGERCYNISLGYDGNVFDIAETLDDLIELNLMFLENKPLHLYSKQEEANLLELLQKLGTN